MDQKTCERMRAELNCELFEFINSDELRVRLLRENYYFDTLQAIYLVWQSRWASVAEQVCAWQKIMDVMPDCGFECGGEAYASIFEILKSHIQDLHTDVERFFEADIFISAPSATVYTASAHVKNTRGYKPCVTPRTNLQECLAELSAIGLVCEVGGDFLLEWKHAITSQDAFYSFYEKRGRFICDRSLDRIIIEKTVLEEEKIALEIFPRGDAKITAGTASGFEAHSLLDICFSSPEFALKLQGIV